MNKSDRNKKHTASLMCLIFIIMAALVLFLTGCKKEGYVMDEGAKIAYEYFIELSEIPRGSGNEKAASDYLMEFAKTHGLYAFQDSWNNVLIKKPGSVGRENEPPIIFQAHIDIVCEKNEGVEHDFLKDPIIPVINGDWVTASKKTTLGADDGSGVSLCMAVLASGTLSHPPLSHPPIEAIFTTDEEVGMTGAINFDASMLSGTRFINVDTEDEGVFFVSSAAGANIDIIIPVEFEAIPGNFTSYSLAIKGLAGGHSGVDINKGLANANRLMAQLLNELSGIDVRLSSINGGSKRNAIPRECTAVVSFSDNDFNAVQSAIKQAETAFKQEYAADKDLSVTLEKMQTATDVMINSSLRNVLEGISRVPNGVLAMSPDIAELVQTSSNLGVVVTDEKTVILSCMPRSSVAAEQAETKNQILSLASRIGAKVEISGENPAWSYKVNSPLRDKMSAVFKDMYGKEPSIKAVHAGLECGIFSEKMPDADMISIGPDIRGAHSPDERMSISSYSRIYSYLVKLLEAL